jgi:hypothetical protein
MNPDVIEAFALAIVASEGPPAFAGVPAPDLGSRRAGNDAAAALRSAAPEAGGRRTRVHAAMAALRTAAPDTGAYVNECDYFQPDWQKAFWGPNYPRLAAIKRRYDPDGLFVIHHGIGSEAGSADGFTRLQ